MKNIRIEVINSKDERFSKFAFGSNKIFLPKNMRNVYQGKTRKTRRKKTEERTLFQFRRTYIGRKTGREVTSLGVDPTYTFSPFLGFQDPAKDVLNLGPKKDKKYIPSFT